MNKENLISCKNLMEGRGKVVEVIKQKKQEYTESIKLLVEDLNHIDFKIVEAKKTIDEDAKKEFKETGNKKLMGGIGIQEKVKVSYNEKDALNWAKQSNLCLLLDTKSFDKLAKTQDLEFVKKEDLVKVTYPKQILLEEEVV